MRTRLHGCGTRHHHRGTRPAGPEVRAARGAILIQVAMMLVGLTAFSAFVIDYGIMWTARRQVQNAADAAALAAAISLGFDPSDSVDEARAKARASAQTAVQQNPVWGAPATMTAADITFAPCPPGAVGLGPCIRVQAFRNRDAGNEISTVFAGLVGVRHQGVRATATAQLLFGNTTDCVRPIAIPDRWVENRNGIGPPGWDPLDTYDHYLPGGAQIPPPRDLYVPPGLPGNNGTGYSRGPALPYNPTGDLGRQIRLRPQHDLMRALGDEQFIPIRVSPGASGPADLTRDITTCAPRIVRPADRLEVEPADVRAATLDGIGTLIAQDPSATWDGALNGGLGGISGGCMASGTCTVSPRIIPAVAFDTDHFASRLPSQSVIVERIVGLFIEGTDGYFFTARLVAYPAAPRSSMTADAASAFVVSVALVR